MLYIEQMPRGEGEPCYVIESDSIQEAQEWCALNCDISKRHVISKTRLGTVMAEGLQIPAYYGYDKLTKKPRFKMLDRSLAYYDGYKVFSNSDAATNYYLEARMEADSILKIQAVEAKEALTVLKSQGVNLGAWATCRDDYGLNYGLCVSCTVDGFYFRREID